MRTGGTGVWSVGRGKCQETGLEFKRKSQLGLPIGNTGIERSLKSQDWMSPHVEGAGSEERGKGKATDRKQRNSMKAGMRKRY